MMREAPAWSAPWTALMPTLAMPMTTVTSPGSTGAPLTAEPHPVGTPQPARQASVRGRSSGILAQLMAGTTVYSEKVETRAICPMSAPSLCIRKVPSS